MAASFYMLYMSYALKLLEEQTPDQRRSQCHCDIINILVMQ